MRTTEQKAPARIKLPVSVSEKSNTYHAWILDADGESIALVGPEHAGQIVKALNGRRYPIATPTK